MLMISVLLVDDDEMVRAGLHLLVERVQDCRVVGAAANGREALLMVEDLCPRVVLTDLVMPLMDGITLTREVRRRYPHVAVLVLTGYPDEFYLTGALNAGATGYLLKGSNPYELDFALCAVARGEAYITPRMAVHLIPKQPDGINDAKKSKTSLTLRQNHILRLVAAGKTNKEIAEYLNVSVKAIEKHRTQLMRRFAVHNAPDLVRCAMERYLLQERKPIKEFTIVR